MAIYTKAHQLFLKKQAKRAAKNKELHARKINAAEREKLSREAAAERLREIKEKGPRHFREFFSKKQMEHIEQSFKEETGPTGETAQTLTMAAVLAAATTSRLQKIRRGRKALK